MKPLAALYREKLSLIEMPADENFRFVKDTKAIDEAVCKAIDALENIAGFAYGCPVDKTFDARDALNELRQVLEGSKVEL